MSEYWKSVPRKFCDFCKCWITDNKPSVDFHEKGKRHQENVQLRLKEIRKKTHEKSLEDKATDKQMEQIEKAALEAFKKDLKKNPDLAAHYGVSLEPKPKAAERKPETSETEPDAPVDDTDKKDDAKVKEWYEAKSPEGYSYYWNTSTGESIWEAPDEYVSLAEQEAVEKEDEKKKEDKKKKEDEKKKEDKSSEDEEESKPKIREDLPSNRSAFGAWNVVKEESSAVYDESSEAPAPEDIPLPGVAVESKPKKEKFKEKTVSSLGQPSGGSVAFKKRKIASGARNVRQRDDND